MISTAIDLTTVAFLDVGTNSIRLLVVQISPNYSFTVTHQLKETVRLGEDEFNHHRLQPDAITRAVRVTQQFADLARATGATEIVAVATSATRDAENQRVFIDRMANEAGVDLRVISGLEEARLIQLGVVSGIQLNGRTALCIDIGGGSTEVSVGNEQQQLYLSSLELGAIRLTTRFLAGATGPVSTRQYERLRSFVRDEALQTTDELRAYPFNLAYGGSGTIENLAEIAARSLHDRSWRRDDVLTLDELREVSRALCRLSVEDRRRVPGMSPPRADIIIGGVAILETLMEEFGINELRVSDRGLREGLLVDYLRRQGHSDLVGGASVRERSVIQLGRRCGFDESHARNTARLALRLFDSGKAAGLHNLGAWEREILADAALLHHIGTFLSHANYQRHTGYLVRNAELLGFDETELALLALTAEYHRNGMPRKKDLVFAGLSDHFQEVVRILSGLLRLGENLDRGHGGVVDDARLERLDAGHMVLQVRASRGWHVERTAIQSQNSVFEKTFGYKLIVSVG